MTDYTTQPLLFASASRRKVLADFQGGDLTSDGGLPLLREVDRKIGLIDALDADGKVTGHGGSWLSGVGGAKFGLMMPGKPKVGNRYFQELAPKVAMDRGEVLSLTEEVKVPAGTFKNCIKIRDSSALESGAENKLYAPDVGLLKDGGFELTKIEKPKPAEAPGK